MKHLAHTISKCAVAALLATTALFGTNQAATAETLVVVTSFPKTLTTPFEQAFEAANPGINVEILQKKTSAGVKYIQEIADNNTADIFWASAPDAFEVLKQDGLLTIVDIRSEGIPDALGAYPINDPDGFYKGFAAAGYGIMWNTRYLKAKGLVPATEWGDLAKPEYHGHVGMSAPSRSGTTHLTVETLLQGNGWEEGWAEWKWIAGNFSTVTERSFGVPDGVNSGQFGLGVVIDFFGLSSKASGFPVDFAYPTVTALVPANVGVVTNAPNQADAVTFIEFLLSPAGQTILLDPAIRRLPVNPAAYSDAPADYPNPFEDNSLGAALTFDVKKSGARYNVVNSLFDVMITYRLDDLRAAVLAVQEAEAALGSTENAEASALIAEARALIAATPIDEAKALDPAFSGIFKKKRKKVTDVIEGRQAEIEQQWDTFVLDNYDRARELAEKASSLL